MDRKPDKIAAQDFPHQESSNMRVTKSAVPRTRKVKLKKTDGDSATIFTQGGEMLTMMQTYASSGWPGSQYFSSLRCTLSTKCTCSHARNSSRAARRGLRFFLSDLQGVSAWFNFIHDIVGIEAAATNEKAAPSWRCRFEDKVQRKKSCG